MYNCKLNYVKKINHSNYLHIIENINTEMEPYTSYIPCFRFYLSKNQKTPARKPNLYYYV